MDAMECSLDAGLASVVEEFRRLDEGNVDPTALFQQLVAAKASTQGIWLVMDWLRSCREGEITRVLLRAIEHIVGRDERVQFSSGDPGFDAPDCYLTFSHNRNSALQLPPLPLNLLRGYTFAARIYLEPFDVRTSAGERLRTLYRFLTGPGDGQEALLRSRQEPLGMQLLMRTRGSGEKKWTEASCNLPVKYKAWHHVVLSHANPYLANSNLSVYVDGVLVYETPLHYSNLDEKSITNTIGAGFGGRIAAPMLLQGAANAMQARELALGRPRCYLEAPSEKLRLGSTRKRKRNTGAIQDYVAKRFSAARVGHQTAEGIADLRTSLKSVLKAAPLAAHALKTAPKRIASGISGTVSNQSQATDTSSEITPQREDESSIASSYDERIRKAELELGDEHEYDDLPVVFAIDPKTCVGGSQTLPSENPNVARVENGVILAQAINGKRRGAGGDVVIEPSPLIQHENHATTSTAMHKVAHDTTNSFSSLIGKAAAVFDISSRASLEAIGGLSTLLILFHGFVPPSERRQRQYFQVLGDIPTTSDVLAQLVKTLGVVLRANKLYRSEFQTLGGFGLLGSILGLAKAEALSVSVAEEVFRTVLDGPHIEKDASLRCEGVLLVLLNLEIWARAPAATQISWAEHILEYVTNHPLEGRVILGVQGILDALSLCSRAPTKNTTLIPPSVDPTTMISSSAQMQLDEQYAIAPECVDLLVDVIKIFFSCKGVDHIATELDAGPQSEQSYSSRSAKKTRRPSTSSAPGVNSDQNSSPVAFSTTAGPQPEEISTVLVHAARHPRDFGSAKVLLHLASLLVPLTTSTQTWAEIDYQIAGKTYAGIQTAGGVDFLLGLASRHSETRQQGATRKGIGSTTLVERHTSGTPNPESHPNIGKQNSTSAPSEEQASEAGSLSESLEDSTRPDCDMGEINTQQRIDEESEPFGLLSAAHGAHPEMRAAMILLIGRMVDLEIQNEVLPMTRAQDAQKASILEADLTRRQKQFGIVLRALQPVPLVSSHQKLPDSKMKSVSNDVHPIVLDALLSIVLGCAASHEQLDDFMPQDDMMVLALPVALPVLGGMLASLSEADQETKAIAAREVLLKLSLVLKASSAAREQVTAMPQWQTWLLPVMLLDESSLNKNDDQSADYLLGEVATDLLCTLMEHETQHENENTASAKLLETGRVKFGWQAWQGLAEGAMRITKEKEKSARSYELEFAKQKPKEAKLSLPEINAMIETKATQKSARVIRQTLERVWERLTVRLRAGGLHPDAVVNFLMTLVLAEQALISPINSLRLFPLSQGGVISSSSALPYVAPSTDRGQVHCGSRSAIDGKHDTKWVDVTQDISGENSHLLASSQSSRSWLSYCYPSNTLEGHPTSHRVVFYSVKSAFDMPELDPSGWTLFGRQRMTDATPDAGNVGWAVLDRRSNINFPGRYHAINCWVKNTGFYDEYKIIFDPPQRKGKTIKTADGSKVFARVQIGELTLFECDDKTWHHDSDSSLHQAIGEIQDSNMKTELQAHNEELTRFIGAALGTIRFIRSGNADDEHPRILPAAKSNGKHETEASAQKHNLPQRGVVRLLGHVMRFADVFPQHMVEDNAALIQSYLVDDLSGQQSPATKSLVLVLLHCIHHGICRLHTSESKDAETKIETLFQVVRTILIGLQDVFKPVPESLLEQMAKSRENFLTDYRILGLQVESAIERELEAEALSREIQFIVQRSSSTAMAKRANPVEIAAYGAGKAFAPLGVGRATKKNLQLLLSKEDERRFTTYVNRVALCEEHEFAWRTLLEDDEVHWTILNKTFTQSVLSETRTHLYSLGTFVEPTQGIRMQLVPNPNGDPHFGAASGILDRMERKKHKEASKQSVVDQDEVAPRDLNSSTLQGSSTSEFAWKDIGASLSKQIAIEDSSLMTRADEEKGLVEATGDDDQDDDDDDDDDDDNHGDDCDDCDDNPGKGNEIDQTHDGHISGLADHDVNDETNEHSSSKFVINDDVAVRDEARIGDKAQADKSKTVLSATSPLREHLSVVTKKGKTGPESGVDHESEKSLLRAKSSSAGGSASSPLSPGSSVNAQAMPSSIESRRKLTLEEWINRSPDPIRGESKHPWPSKGENVFTAARCYLIMHEFEMLGRIIISRDAIYFDPDQPEAEELYMMRPENYDKSQDRSGQDAHFEGMSATRWQQELFGQELEDQLDAAERKKLFQTKRRRRRVWQYNDLKRILLRRFRMRDSALELFIEGNEHESFLFDFEPVISCKVGYHENGKPFVTEQQMHSGVFARNSIMHKLWKVLPHRVVRRSQHPGVSIRSLVARYTRQWQARKLSNFDYLMRLNSLAGRSTNDLTQYPVFPWVLADYRSEELDLENPEVYRDLSKPMGAMNKERLEEARERYRTFDDPCTPKFHYGSHYSTMAGVVLYFLVRLEPFTTLHIQMQDGHLDIPDRLFNSIPATWELCTTAMSEVKELTPEFYYLPEFLLNHNKFDLGTLQTGEAVGNVELPPWAKGSPTRFIAKMREALESDYVSENLHSWIDLIFGYKSRLPDAVEADNVFYYLTYPGAVDMEAIEDPAMRLATELQIKHFGQCPQQIFVRPHPPRGSPPGPPFLLGRILRETVDNAVGQASKIEIHNNWSHCFKFSKGSVIAVRIFKGRAACLCENGEVYSFLWGLDESSDRSRERSNSSGTEHSETEGLHLEDEENQQKGAAASAKAKYPLAILPVNLPGDTTQTVSSETNAFETSSIASAFCVPVQVVKKSPTSKPVIAWSVNGRILVHGGPAPGAMEVHFIDTDSSHLRAWSATVVAHSEPISAIAVSGPSLVSGAEDGTLRVWDLLDTSSSKGWGVAASPRLALKGHRAPIKTIAVSAQQGVVLSSSSELCLVHSFMRGTLRGALPQATEQGQGGAALATISDKSGLIALVTQAQCIMLFKTSLVSDALGTVRLPQTEKVGDMAFSRLDFGLAARELLLCACSSGNVTVRSTTGALAVVATFKVWPDSVPMSINPAPLCSISLNNTEEALLVGAENGSVCLVPLPNLVSYGPHARVPVIGTMDMGTKLASAKNTVLTKIDKTRVFATAKSVASEVGGAASKFARGFQSVFGASSKQ